MINTHIYFHGRPAGQSSIMFNENSADITYLEQFLDAQWGSTVTSALLVDVRLGRFFYTYLRKKSIYELSGRSSAYFAMTLQFDDLCCSNVNGLYLLLNQVYEKLILGKILSSDGGTEKFMIATFEDRKSEFSKIADLLNQNINNVLAPYFIKADINKNGYSSEIEEWNLDDVDSSIFGKCAAKHRILISPEFPSKDDMLKDVNKVITPLKNQCVSLQQDLQKKEVLVGQLNGQLNALNTENKSKDGKIDELTKNVAKIKQETEDSCAAEKKRIATELETARNELNTCKKTNKNLETVKNQLETQVNTQQTTISRQNTEISNKNTEIAQLKNSVKSIKSDTEKSFEQEKTQLSAQITNLTNELNKCKDAKKDGEAKYSDLVKQYNDLVDKYKLLHDNKNADSEDIVDIPKIELPKNEQSGQEGGGPTSKPANFLCGLFNRGNSNSNSSGSHIAKISLWLLVLCFIISSAILALEVNSTLKTTEEIAELEEIEAEQEKVKREEFDCFSVIPYGETSSDTTLCDTMCIKFEDKVKTESALYIRIENEQND